MIEPWVHEFEADDGKPGVSSDFVVCSTIGSEPVPGEDQRADDQQVALAFIDVAGVRRGIAG